MDGYYSKNMYIIIHIPYPIEKVGNFLYLYSYTYSFPVENFPSKRERMETIPT